MIATICWAREAIFSAEHEIKGLPLCNGFLVDSTSSGLVNKRRNIRTVRGADHENNDGCA